MLRTTALLQAGEEARAALEEKLSVYVENLEYLQGQVETGGSQISRGNAAVERLQGEGRQLRDKIKLKSEIIRKQVQRVTMSTLLFPSQRCSALLVSILLDHPLQRTHAQLTSPRLQSSNIPSYSFFFCPFTSTPHTLPYIVPPYPFFFFTLLCQEALVTDLRSQGAEQGLEITRGRDALRALKLQVLFLHDEMRWRKCA